MPTFLAPDGLALAYLDEGNGDPVVLLHGFAADARINWVGPGIVAALVEAGHRVVAPDARGHGASSKPHDPVAYAGDAMAHDVGALLDHLDLDTAALVGYSMGALVGQRVAALDPRVRVLVLGGIGGWVTEARIDRGEIAAALAALDDAVAASPMARAFRAFARSTGADLQALAASQRGGRPSLDGLRDLRIPVLVVAGADDDLAGDPGRLAALIPGARALTVPGDHLTAVATPELRDAIVGFVSTPLTGWAGGGLGAAGRP